MSFERPLLTTVVESLLKKLYTEIHLYRLNCQKMSKFGIVSRVLVVRKLKKKEYYYYEIYIFYLYPDINI